MLEVCTDAPNTHRTGLGGATVESVDAVGEHGEANEQIHGPRHSAAVGRFPSG